MTRSTPITAVDIFPPEIWSRILDHTPRRTARALYLTNHHLNQSMDLSGYLFKTHDFRSLIRLNPHYPPLLRYLTQKMEEDPPMGTKKGRIDPILFHSLKTALICGHRPLIQLLTPSVRTRKTKLIIMGIVFDLFPTAAPSSTIQRTHEECENLIEYFLNTWISNNEDHVHLFWLIMRQGFLWNAHQAIDCCLKWLTANEKNRKQLKKKFMKLVIARDYAMESALEAKTMSNVPVDYTLELEKRFPEIDDDDDDDEDDNDNNNMNLSQAISSEDNLFFNFDESDYEMTDAFDFLDSLEEFVPRFLFDDTPIASDNIIAQTAESGNLRRLRRLLNDPFGSPHAQNGYAIRLAARNGHVDCVKLLLTNSWVTPIVCANESIRSAAHNGHVEIVKLLLADSRVDPHACDNEAIRSAAYKGHAEIVKLLLKHSRVDPTACDNEAIRNAAVGDHPDVIKVLLEDPRVDPGALHNEAIEKAASLGHTDVVQLLLADERVNPADRNNETFRHVTIEGHLKIIKMLLADPRVNPGDAGNEALRMASFIGHYPIVKLLLADSRVDPTSFKNQAVHGASINGNLRILELLLSDPRVNPGDRRNIAIRAAAKHGRLHVVNLLLRHKRVNPADVKDNTLLNAVKGSHLPIVETLLRDPRVNPASRHYAAFHLALQKQNPKMFSLLMKHNQTIIPEWILRYWIDY